MSVGDDEATEGGTQELSRKKRMYCGKTSAEMNKVFLEKQQEAVKQSSFYKSFPQDLAEYENLSVEDKIVHQSWLTDSVLASRGRDLKGPDGFFQVFSESDYIDMIEEMVNRIKLDLRNHSKIKHSSTMTDISVNSRCVEHPYGRLVVYCECARPLGRMLPKYRKGSQRCSCSPFSRGFTNPEHCKYNHATVAVVPHNVDKSGVCVGTRGLDTSLSVFTMHFDMFARLTRYLALYSGNHYVMREVLGGPFTGYFQAMVMLAFRFSVSDTVRVTTGNNCQFLVDDVLPSDELSREKFFAELIALRRQGFYRGWMNNLVQNRKLVMHGFDPIPDDEYREKYVRGGMTVTDQDVLLVRQQIDDQMAALVVESSFNSNSNENTPIDKSKTLVITPKVFKSVSTASEILSAVSTTRAKSQSTDNTKKIVQTSNADVQRISKAEVGNSSKSSRVSVLSDEQLMKQEIANAKDTRLIDESEPHKDQVRVYQFNRNIVLKRKKIEQCQEIASKYPENKDRIEKDEFYILHPEMFNAVQEYRDAIDIRDQWFRDRDKQKKLAIAKNKPFVDKTVWSKFLGYS